MSELKAGVITTPHNEGMSFDRGSHAIAVTEGETEFYLKSEADAVLAEKDKEIAELKENYRNLRRHLFNAGAKWAKQEKMRYTSNGMHRMAVAFENMERMCLEMAENLRKGKI